MLVVDKQFHWIDTQYPRDPFHGAQGEVAFAAFDTAQVSAVDTNDLGEGLLGQAAGFAVGPEVPAQCPLEVSFHACNRLRPLLEGLQTYK